MAGGIGKGQHLQPPRHQLGQMRGFAGRFGQRAQARHGGRTRGNGGFAQGGPPKNCGAKAVLHRLADLIERHAVELAVLGVRDNGTEISMALKAEPVSAAATFRYCAEALDKVSGEIAPTAANVLALIHKEPMGVVGAIVPLNFPLMIGAWKIAPALAMGNSVVLKPAETATLTLLRLAALALEAGVPPGVFNMVTGPGRVTGEALLPKPPPGRSFAMLGRFAWRGRACWLKPRFRMNSSLFWQKPREI